MPEFADDFICVVPSMSLHPILGCFYQSPNSVAPDVVLIISAFNCMARELFCSSAVAGESLSLTSGELPSLPLVAYFASPPVSLQEAGCNGLHKKSGSVTFSI